MCILVVDIYPRCGHKLMSRDSCYANNPFCCDDPIATSKTVEGKCGMCREKDHNNFIKKKQAKLKSKRAAKGLQARKEEKSEINFAVQKLKKELDSEHAADDMTEKTSPIVKRHRPTSPQHDPQIKVKNDETPYFYEKLIESAREAGKITKKQRKGEAGIGHWIPVKWYAANSTDEDADVVDSAVSDVDSDSNSKSKSVISDLLSEHRRANNHLKGKNGRKA